MTTNDNLLDEIGDLLFADREVTESISVSKGRSSAPIAAGQRIDVIHMIGSIEEHDYGFKELRRLKKCIDDKLGIKPPPMENKLRNFHPGMRVKFNRQMKRSGTNWPSGVYWGRVEKTMTSRVKVRVYVDPKSRWNLNPDDRVRRIPVIWKCYPSSLQIVSDSEWDAMIDRIKK